MKKVLFMMLIMIIAVTTAACGSGTVGNTNSEETNTGGSANGSDAVGQPKTPEEPTELTITHQLGETKVKENPETVVVFDFGTLDTLDQLGVKVTAVPQSNLPAYLDKYASNEYKNVGGLMEPDFEGIAALNPDLIIISGRQSASYEEFSKLGPTIFMGVDTSRYMESFTENVQLLGEIFGKESEAEQQLAAIEASIQRVHDKATTSSKNGLIILTTGGKVSAYGSGSRFGIIHDVLGVTPVDENIEVSTHGMSVSFEYIMEKNPDYLFVVDRDAVVEGGTTSAKEVVENDLIKNTNAFKNGHIVYLDPNYWYLSGGGLVSVAEMAKAIEEGIK